MGTGKSPFLRALGCRQEIVKLLAALLSRTPASVLLPSVAAASRRRLSWVLKQTKALLWSEVWAQALEHRLSRWQAAVGLLCVVPAAGVGGGGGRGGRSALPLTLQSAVPRAASPHKAHSCHLGWRVLRSVCMWPWAEVLRQAFCTGNSSLKGCVWDLCTQDPVSQWN